MYKEEFAAMANAATVKLSLLKKNPLGYFFLSMLAGAYIGFGILLIFTIGGLLNGNPATKLVMGLSFGVALSLVVIAGGELFTGNTMVMSSGVMEGKVSLADTIKLWVVCWLGNLAGSMLLALLFFASGLQTEAVATFIAKGALAKMSAGFIPLLSRGILCNILVCLAVWCGFRVKSDSARILMCFWCLFAFITTGFEHSVTNMTLLTSALLNPAGQAVSLGGWCYNLLVVTLGNMIGGILFVAAPYFIGSRDK